MKQTLLPRQDDVRGCRGVGLGWHGRRWR